MNSALLEQELKILIQENDDLRKEVLKLKKQINHLEEQNSDLHDLLHGNDTAG